MTEIRATEKNGKAAGPPGPVRPRRRPRWSLLALLGAAGGLLVWSAVRGELELQEAAARFEPQGRLILADEPVGASVARDDAGGTLELRVAVAPMQSAERSYAIYSPLVEHLGKAVGRKGHLLLRGSYAEVNEMLRQGACDLAFVCTYPYVQGRHDFGMRALVVPASVEGTRYRALIITARGRKADGLEDFKGQRFAYARDFSTVGWLYPADWLKRHGHDPASFFGSRIQTGSHDRALRAVISGLADVASISSAVFEQLTVAEPGLRQEVKVVQVSDWFDPPPVAIPPSMDPALERGLRQAFLDMHRSAEGQAILKNAGVERFMAPPPGSYRSIAKMQAGLGSRP